MILIKGDKDKANAFCLLWAGGLRRPPEADGNSSYFYPAGSPSGAAGPPEKP